ncbi:MAG TPA: tRNA (adenosine(37)-N6)-dimethylallyltransferase MiaA, partial [Acidimicrobiales bacterium]
ARPGVVELVSVDSMAVYRGMDLGTAKAPTAVRAEVPYHLVDLVDPDEEYTVTRFQTEARAALEGIAFRAGKALLVGGTGLYLRAVTDDLSFPGRFPSVAEGLAAELDDLGPEGSGERLAGCAGLHARLEGLDPVAAGRIERGNERRLVRALEVTLGSGQPFSSFGPGLERYPPSRMVLLGLQRDPEESDRRIAERFARLMDEGFLDEVRGLVALPGGMSRTARQALGYRELLAHLEEGVPLAAAVDEAVRRTRAFAKRQRAWFRRDPRIEWLDPDGDPVAEVLDHLERDATGLDGWGATRSDRWGATGSDR